MFEKLTFEYLFQTKSTYPPPWILQLVFPYKQELWLRYFPQFAH